MKEEYDGSAARERSEKITRSVATEEVSAAEKNTAAENFFSYGNAVCDIVMTDRRAGTARHEGGTRVDWAIEVEDMTVAYDERPVLWDVDLEVPKGSLTAIVGPNGAGKSTLIKAMLNLLTRVSGTVKFYIDGHLATTKDDLKRIAYVPQSGSVDWDFPTTVLDVVMMGRYGHLGWFRRPGAKEKELAFEMLRMTGMEDYADRQISRLSGGQQQRVFLARALIQEADIYFMDEPFKGVDVKTEKAIITLLKEMKKKGKTVVVVHHDLATVPEYFDWLILINLRKIASGPMETTFTKDNLEATYHAKNPLAREVSS